MNRWLRLLSSGSLLSLLLLGSLVLRPAPALGLSLNPLDYYSFDYHISISHQEVEPGDSFSLSAGATVRCTKDLPVGVRKAVVRFAIVAHHATSGEQITLLDGYEVTVANVPDWAGDEYSAQESVSLSFPSGAATGSYSLVARLEYVSLDGLNFTGMVPGSARNVELGGIGVAVPDEPDPPTPTQPPPPIPEPGVLTVSILGHTFRPAVDNSGHLTESLEATTIEELVSLTLPSGTQCVDASGEPLDYISVSRVHSPRPYAGGAVVSAFNLLPDGARFAPSLRLGISYTPDELPQGCDEADLALGYYDRATGAWLRLASTVDEDGNCVFSDVEHFTTFGLLAPVTVAGPARFTVRELDVTPAEVAPFGRVTAAITIANTGDSRDTYPLLVKVNGQQECAQDIDVAARQSTTVRVTMVRSQPGTYRVSVENLSQSFTVRGVAPTTPTTPSSGQPPAEPDNGDSETPAAPSGMHPVLVGLLILGGIAFLGVVVLVLAGVL